MPTRGRCRELQEQVASLSQALLEEDASIILADEVACLLKWLREEILPPRGSDYTRIG